MTSKIKTLTIVNQQSPRTYYIGSAYGGMVLDRIEDRTAEFPDSMIPIYMGFAKNGDTVFEVINAPIVVEYKIAQDPNETEVQPKK